MTRREKAALIAGGLLVLGVALWVGFAFIALLLLAQLPEMRN